MGYSEQCSKNNIIFRHIGIQRRCRNNNIIITMVGPTIYTGADPGFKKRGGPIYLM